MHSQQTEDIGQGDQEVQKCRATPVIRLRGVDPSEGSQRLQRPSQSPTSQAQVRLSQVWPLTQHFSFFPNIIDLPKGADQ